MVTPATERKRKQREREKALAEKNKLKGGGEAAELFRMPFSECAEDDPNIGECTQYMALVGIEFPEFDDERDPEEFVIDRHAFGDEPLFGKAKGALGRAEIMIDCFIDTAITLAGVVNTYKQQEIKARLAELEQSTDVDRATAMQEAVRLNKILDHLSKEIRRGLPQWKGTGI
jgi:hypothetical protein